MTVEYETRSRSRGYPQDVTPPLLYVWRLAVTQPQRP
jgi:hypothetical protein